MEDQENLLAMKVEIFGENYKRTTAGVTVQISRNKEGVYSLGFFSNEEETLLLSPESAILKEISIDELKELGKTLNELIESVIKAEEKRSENS
ncbi:hypothetical protein [Dysgonomonas gadei]|uniref:Uncharacterized protein n=1 Tax=Dysgonomonas gadei ATCC BAA-286 TaxID=742766 RepID=F5J2C6_9BACT|nr:hypothetical protein [Dysgonomonas gadei]EGK00161.1 hypothetical protein HMPREF9455_03493 [Dysgonomonas gadei ATCC BAA-286]